MEFSLYSVPHHRYLKELRQHYSVFPTESLILIFSNIEKIFRFQQKFLERLRIGIEHNKVADTFLEFVSFPFCSVVVFFYMHLKAIKSNFTTQNEFLLNKTIFIKMNLITFFRFVVFFYRLMFAAI